MKPSYFINPKSSLSPCHYVILLQTLLLVLTHCNLIDLPSTHSFHRPLQPLSSASLFYPSPILFQWESFLGCDHLPRPENEAAVNSFLTAWEEEEDWLNIDTLLEGLREAEEVIMGTHTHTRTRTHADTHTHTRTHTHAHTHTALCSNFTKLESLHTLKLSECSVCLGISQKFVPTAYIRTYILCIVPLAALIVPLAVYCNCED